MMSFFVHNFYFIVIKFLTLICLFLRVNAANFSQFFISSSLCLSVRLCVNNLLIKLLNLLAKIPRSLESLLKIARRSQKAFVHCKIASFGAGCYDQILADCSKIALSNSA
jgi:Gpi18-like mannosyltransferase